MIKQNSITIHAGMPETFAVASDLPGWPSYLSHYRYNKFLSRMPWGGIVKMCCVRDFIPTKWVSVYRIDVENQQMQFQHLKSTFNATRGMIVVWQFDQSSEGTHITIRHEHKLDWPIIGGFVANVIIGQFFIANIANKTLQGLKRRMEG